MKNLTKHVTYMNLCKAIIVTGLLSLGVLYASAFTAPTSAPTGGNVAAPINTSSVTQTKTGGIGAQYFAGGSARLLNNCSVIMCNFTGTVIGKGDNPLGARLNGVPLVFKGLIVNGFGNISIKDGNQAAGMVLTSDADGMATWQPLPAVLPTGSIDGQTLRWDSPISEWEVTRTLTTRDDGVDIFGTNGSPTLRLSDYTGNGALEIWPDGLGGGAPNAFMGFDTGVRGGDALVLKHQNNGGPNGDILLQVGNGVVGINTISNTGFSNADNVVLSLGGTVRINDQTGGSSDRPAPGKVLTAIDTNGTAKWRSLPTSGTPISDNGAVNTHYAYNSGSGRVTAYCPTSHPVVIGGGADCDQNGGAFRKPGVMLESRPYYNNSAGQNGWIGKCAPGDVSVWAICSPLQ